MSSMDNIDWNDLKGKEARGIMMLSLERFKKCVKILLLSRQE